MSGPTPAITLAAFETRDPGKVFVKVPNERGRWMLTERCVVEVACGMCGAGVGEPCFTKETGIHRRYIVGTHHVRRLAWKGRPDWQQGVHEEDLVAKPHIRLRVSKRGRS